MVFLTGPRYLINAVFKVLSIKDLGALDMEVRRIFILIISFIAFLVIWEMIEAALYLMTIKSSNWKNAVIKTLSASSFINLDHFHPSIYKKKQVLTIKKKKI